jgi:hypothetical protein
MQALRQFHKPENGVITVQLPADFDADEVEVIILPKAPVTNGAYHKQNEIEQAIRSFLSLDTSRLTPEQLKAYQRTCILLQKGRHPNEPRMFGLFAGLVEVSDDFNTLADEEIDLFYTDNIFPPDSTEQV